MSVLDEEKVQDVRNVLVLARPYKELVALSECGMAAKTIFHLRSYKTWIRISRTTTDCKLLCYVSGLQPVLC